MHRMHGRTCYGCFVTLQQEVRENFKREEALMDEFDNEYLQEHEHSTFQGVLDIEKSSSTAATEPKVDGKHVIYFSGSEWHSAPFTTYSL